MLSQAHFPFLANGAIDWALIVFQRGLVPSQSWEAGQGLTGSRDQLWGPGAPGGWQGQVGKSYLFFESIIGPIFSKH